LFVVTLILGGIVTSLFRALVEATGLGGLDRLLGVLFGAARGLVIVLAIVILLPMALPVKEDAWWHQSRLIPHFEALEGWARAVFDELLHWGQSLSRSAPALPAPPPGATRV